MELRVKKCQETRDHDKDRFREINGRAVSVNRRINS